MISYEVPLPAGDMNGHASLNCASKTAVSMSYSSSLPPHSLPLPPRFYFKHCFLFKAFLLNQCTLVKIIFKYLKKIKVAC